MPMNRNRIVDYLAQHPEGADDDQLAAALSISSRQQVNQICRALAGAGLIYRRKNPFSGKIVNRLVDDAASNATAIMSPGAVALPPDLTPTVTPTDLAYAGRAVVLRDEAAARQFAYAGEAQLTEDQVKQAVATALEADAWSVAVHWGHAHGIDIEARRGAERLVIEAKGEGSLSPMRVNYFLGALGELLQRMDSPDAGYGLALPAHRQFVGLVLRLPVWVRSRLNLCFFLVRTEDQNGLKVGLIPSETTIY